MAKAKEGKRVSPADFVKAWQTSDSVDEVVNKTGLSKSAVTGRAGQYRKNKVLLKAMPRKREAIDYKELQKLAQQLSA